MATNRRREPQIIAFPMTTKRPAKKAPAKAGAKVRRGPCAEIIPFPFPAAHFSPYEHTDHFEFMVNKVRETRPTWSHEECRNFVVALYNVAMD